MLRARNAHPLPGAREKQLRPGTGTNDVPDTSWAEETTKRLEESRPLVVARRQQDTSAVGEITAVTYTS